MDERLKQRLVGAIVLVSLAVIFIPMLLEGGRPDGAPDSDGTPVPERPGYRFETIEIPLDVPQDRADPVRVVHGPETSRGESAEGPEQDELPGRVPQPGDIAPTMTEKPLAVPAGQPEAWVVQVGSFSSEANALALRGRVRKLGFAAFVEEVTTEGSRVYRVRVGPELRRELAEVLRGQLAERAELDGLVMSHP